MVGLGEGKEEVLEVLEDLRGVDVMWLLLVNIFRPSPRT